MAFSSGTRSLMGEAIGWAVAALMIVFGIINYEALKSVAATALGLTPEAAANAAASLDAAEKANRLDAPHTASTGGFVVELKAGPGGHYHTTAEVNGRDVEVLVDTGATMVALTEEDAERAGIFLKDSDFTHRVSTANGIARVAPVTIDRISIGDITVRNVEAAVCERGKLATTLLGMSFLSRLDRVDMRSGVLVLED